ncbi:MAG: MBL fold metallo-hydrolase [Ruminococcus sp.]|nr:MBL fold metallo-hydrolase [Ruminococcus sp.]
MSRRKKQSRRRNSLQKARFTAYLLAAAVIAALVLTVLVRTGVIDGSLLFKQPAAPDASDSVRFIDVGQGDCTLCVSDGQAMLIDSGESDGRDSVIAYIRSLDIPALDCVVITHPHSDHMGEMADIIKSFDVGRVIMPDIPDRLAGSTASCDKLIKAADRRGVGIDRISRDESFEVGNFGVKIYAPAELSEDINDDSLVVRITHGENSFLVTGDCGEQEEKGLIARGAELRADVLKVGHHGSTSASSEIFLAAVRPSYAVISCGADNDYGHPSEKTLVKLSALAGKTYITRDCGTVTFVSDGKGLTVIPEKEQSER